MLSSAFHTSVHMCVGSITQATHCDVSGSIYTCSEKCDYKFSENMTRSLIVVLHKGQTRSVSKSLIQVNCAFRSVLQRIIGGSYSPNLLYKLPWKF